MTSFSCLFLLTVILDVNHIRPYSCFTVTRDISDVVILDTSARTTTDNNCSAIDGNSLSSGKGCRCYWGGTYYTASSGGTKCHIDSGQSCADCQWQTGDGISSFERHIGRLSNAVECYERCKSYTHLGHSPNGATVDKSTGRTCYCEFYSTGRDRKRNWKTCIFRPGHNTKFISDQYVKMVNICIGFGTYIGTFSSCSDAYIHEVHYWKDDGVWGSTLWHHNFEIKGSELHWDSSAQSQIISKNYGLLWRITLNCWESNLLTWRTKCLLLKIGGTRSYPLSFTSVSTACLYDRSTTVRTMKTMSSSIELSLSMPTSHMALAVMTTPSTISSTLVSAFSTFPSSSTKVLPPATSSRDMTIKIPSTPMLTGSITTEMKALKSYATSARKMQTASVVTTTFTFDKKPNKKDNVAQRHSATKKTSPGAIVAGCVFAFVAVITAIILFVWRKKRREKENNTKEKSSKTVAHYQAKCREYADADTVTLGKLNPLEINSPTYTASISLGNGNSATQADRESNNPYYGGVTSKGKSEYRRYENTNQVADAKYSYACPDGIDKTYDQANKERTRQSSSYEINKNREFVSENPYYGRDTILSDGEHNNSCNYRTSDRKIESEGMYADMDAILAENPDNKRKRLATRCSSSKNNPSCKRELTLPDSESSTYDLESDNPYYGGIVPPENVQDGSCSSKSSHQNIMGEDDYAEIENTPSDFNSPKRTGSAAEHNSVSTNVAFDSPAYGSSLPLGQMKGYKNSVHNPVCDHEYSCVTTNALTGNASHIRKASNDDERNKDHRNRKNTGKSPYNVSKNVAKKPFGRNQSPIYNALDDNQGHDDDFSVYERPEENEQPLSVAMSNNLPLYEVLQNQDTFNRQPLNSSYTKTNHSGTVSQSRNKRRVNQGFEIEENKYEI